MNTDNQSHREELENYGRHLCLRMDGVPTVKDESVSNDLLNFTNLLFKEAKVAVSESVLDHARRIGPSYMDRKSKK